MSNKPYIRGKAFEYACITALHRCISDHRTCEVEQSASLLSARHAWELLADDDRAVLDRAAVAAIPDIFALEPRITEPGGDRLTLTLQADRKGGDGDVRDVLIVRSSIDWEIGLSLKHNNFAVKHSRLGPRLDFGESWFGTPCSGAYWSGIAKPFDFLRQAKDKNLKFSELPDKDSTVYIPVLDAFRAELLRLAASDPSIPAKLVAYLLGNFDFYKIIGLDHGRMTKIQPFNLHGTLNRKAGGVNPTVRIPLVSMPTRIISLDFAPGSTTTLELYLDRGWQFTFRLHNAATYAEPSLKFDIRIVGLPTAIITINCIWK